MSDETTTPLRNGSKLKGPEEFMMMGFDTPKRADDLKRQKINAPLSPLIPCPPDDPFDVGELAVAVQNDPFEVTAVIPPPAHSASNVESTTADPTVGLFKASETSFEGYHPPQDNAECPSVPGSPQSPFLEIPRVISRALSDLDLTAASSRGLISSTPLARSTHRDPRAFPGRSPIPRHRVRGISAGESQFENYLQEKRQWLETVKQSLRRPSVSHDKLRRSLSSPNIPKQATISDEDEYLDAVDLDGSFIELEEPQLELQISVIQNELQGKTCLADLRKEAVKLSNVFRSLSDYENLVDEDIRLNFPPWEEDGALNQFLSEIEDTDEFGLPQVRTYPDVMSSSKLDTSQQEMDSLLERYRAHRNSIHMDDGLEGSEACADVSTSSGMVKGGAVNGPRCKNSTKIIDNQGLSNVPIIQPPPLPESTKIEVKPKSTIVTKRGPMRATIPIPSMLKAGPSKAESQVKSKDAQSQGSAAGSTRSPRRAPSPKKVPTVPSTLSRSKTTGTIGLRGSLLKKASTSPSSSSGVGVSPKRAFSEERLGAKSSKDSSSGLRLPTFRRLKPPSVTASPGVTTPKSYSSKGVLTPVTSQPAGPSAAKPVLKNPKPQVPGKENQETKLHAKTK